jgi:benzylsuccinate CoA-transferase BbsF subunit
MTQFAYPDPLSALYGLFAVMSALEYKRNSGRGQIINLSQLEATVASIGHELMVVFANDGEPAKLGNGSLHYAPQGCYPCRGEDRWCVVSVETEQQWRRLCLVLDQPQWLQDPRFVDRDARIHHREQLDSTLAAVSCDWQDYELMHRLQGEGIAAGVVQNVEDQYRRDPHLAERGYFETIAHRVLGQVVAPGIPLGLCGTPGRTLDSGRAIGCDNRAVFCELLGLAEKDYQALLAASVIED